MLLPILLTCITLVAAKEKGPACTTCVRLNSICHNISHILNFQAPFRQTVVISKLGILHSKNVLYYAFEPNITDPEYYKVGYVNLDTPETNGILDSSKPVTNFKTFAIDQGTNMVYIGGGDAIYILDNMNKGVFYSSGGDTIQAMFFKKNLFFIRYGENRIIEKEDELFKVHEKYRNVKDFVIDKNNVLVFLNTSGLYANKLNTNDTIYLSKNSYFRGLSIDLDDVIYAWWIDGIYKVTIDSNLEDSTIDKVAEIEQIGSITFDNDNNLLFSSSRGLFRLIEANTTLC